MTATKTEERSPVTVEQVNELPADHDRCVVIVLVLPKRFAGFLIRASKKRVCGKRATCYVLVSCPGHGSGRLPVCTRHMKAMQDNRLDVGCNTCLKPAVWTESPF